MRRTFAVAVLLGIAVLFAGCPGEMLPRWLAGPPLPPNSARAGDPASAVFAVAWCTSDDPAKAGQTAAANAIEALGCPARGLIFYEYFPKTVKDEKGKESELPDAEKEKKVLPGVRVVAESIPVIGCRARSLVNGGTKLSNTVAALAIGGRKVACKAVKAPLADDRKAVGAAIAAGLKDVRDLKIVFALSEMRLSFETKKGVSVEDFIRGVLETAGKGVTLFGGNCMPDNYPGNKAGAQFIDDEALSGHVVAMGIGGPIAVYANHSNEFAPSAKTVTVTKAREKWVLELDRRPAADVYREIRGMKPNEPFTSDWQHPIGVIVGEDKVYLRMVLEEKKANKALRFVAAVPEGTKVKILIGGDKAEPILASAREGILESVKKSGDAEPLVALISDCCARGARLRKFRKASECEVRQAILPALGDKAGFPIFGFYAWGELGPIAGPFAGLTCMYQQHTFVSALVCEAK